ncbi:enolase C-terminal domain-like protein [Cellulosimicrobium sp. E-16]|uniref:enolase C-terminal domain-like protein n=1 Tax=Cellulosimicrobium sp. E-16 TaxID=3404049 RepID=UPI003CFB24C4
MSVGPAARVVAVRTATTVVPLPQPLRLGAMTVERREYVGVRVVAETDDGRTVAGESYALTREAPMAELVDRLVAPHVVGREVVASDGVTARESVGAAWDAALRGSAIVGRVGLVRRAIGLVDVALWDLAGRLAGRPVWSLLDDGADLSGAVRPGAAEDREASPGRVPAPRPAILVAAYPTPGRTARDVADEVLAHARSGWPLLKISRSPDRALMRDLLAILRAELPDVTGRPTVAGRSGVVVDVGFGWRDADEALADLDAWGVTGAAGQPGDAEPALAWLEDPLLPEDAVGAARVRDASGLPLSVGDEVTDPEVFAHLAMLGALDVPRVDVVAIGGITVADPLVRAWAARGMVVSSHVYPEVSAHLGGAAGIGVETFDRSPAGNPYDPAPLLVRGGPVFDGGHATPPDAPGLGFTLDPDRFDLEAPS